MKSCDKLMCSNILEHITYNDMTLFDGISNNLRFFEYANQKIYFPDGRGYIDFTELLRKMEISYEFLNVKQLSGETDIRDVLVLLPKELLDSIDIIKPKATGIYIVYSAFAVKKITKDSITLGISDYKFKYEKTLRLSQLEKLVELPSKPLSYVVKIIKIDKSKKLDRKLQLKSLKRNLIDFSIDRTEENEGTICIKGAQFYDEMSEVLKGFSLDKIKKENKIKFFIFAGALNAGGEAFYRYDFLQSLL